MKSVMKYEKLYERSFYMNAYVNPHDFIVTCVILVCCVVLHYVSVCITWKILIDSVLHTEIRN